MIPALPGPDGKQSAPLRVIKVRARSQSLSDEADRKGDRQIDLYRPADDEEAMRRLKLVEQVKPRRSLSPAAKEWLETILVAAVVIVTAFYIFEMVQWFNSF
jgi:hypothetical protein